jgi:hypothetical protein
MDAYEATSRILDIASRVVLPTDKKDVVSIARSQFSRFGHCDAKYVDPIEAVITELLDQWSWQEKAGIWQSMNTSEGEPFDPDEIYPGIDLTLHDELLGYVIEELSARDR